MIGEVLKKKAVDLARHVLQYGVPKGTLLNVNVPYCDPKKSKGLRLLDKEKPVFQGCF
ncbi:MAG: hypothetical protein Ct9H300mP2_4830 [Candidatus Neomarinimicrobiota bacterium]|nr:MAG: hypothetical protein Ct9H300mP2_4830 [Candidatus Neomarinimicrobiota bacterium]